MIPLEVFLHNLISVRLPPGSILGPIKVKIKIERELVSDISFFKDNLKQNWDE